jgi:lipopolysaccharide transport system ATP-binding protein
VLAVGDAEFQKKCLGKMSEVAVDGRTVLFVSHNLDALRRTCEAGILLVRGSITMSGGIDECIEKYYGLLHGPATQHRLCFPPASQERHHIIDIEVLDHQLKPIARPATWEPVVFAIRFYSPVPTPNAAVTFQISTTDGDLVTFCATTPDQEFRTSFKAGENILHLRFESLVLSAGTYVVGAGLAIANTTWLYNEPHAAVIEVAPRNVYNASLSPTLQRYPVPMPCRWEKVPQTAVVRELQT